VNGLKEHLVARVVSGDQGEQEDLATLRKLENVQVQVKYIPYTARIYKTFSQLNSDQIGKWVVLTGTVIQAMQKKTLDKSKLFVCCSCGAAYRVRIDYQNCYRFEMPALCPQMVKKPKSKNFLTQLFANFHQRRSSSPSRQR
jgi:DNA replicative helicase MCM subunit Mcm2 (Cdc46/Mcm family)